jgi:two-component system, cell cycle sensor histidine kinase and response regulator CckA
MATRVIHKSEVTGKESNADHRSVLLMQKSELIGELAQAMANQFNNIMMAVTSYAELELKKAGSKEKKSLERVLTHATQATFLIQKLLDFSRGRTASPQPFDLDQSLNEINELLRELLGEHTELSLILGANSQVIHADRIELEEALFALAVIVRNSLPGGGRVTVSTSVVDLDQDFIGTDAAEPGKFLALTLESHPAEGARPKRPAKHKSIDQSQTVNLSLAAVRGIVKDCRGLARISIEPGAGSSFKLYFPALVQEAASEQSSNLPRNPAVARTILVVEDDDAVRVPAAEFLMMEGFKVLQARAGSEALNVAQQSRSSLDILVTDILMPKMNGHEVAAALRAEHPDLKVLYISGDPGRTAPRGTEISADAILRKPFRLNILRDKIHDLLGE